MAGKYWGGQNSLYKFCGGHGPPGPPGSDAYGKVYKKADMSLLFLYSVKHMTISLTKY